MESKTKTCQNCKTKFTIEPEDFEFYKKIDVSEPTFCPECRAKRRFIFSNERSLYKRKCDFSGKQIFSLFSPKTSVKVYEQDVWWSDKWDPMDYGREYNFNRSFLNQLNNLSKDTPWLSRIARKLVNSDYSVQCSFLKNCYLLSFAGHCEDCAYGSGIDRSKDCYDNHNLRRCEFCYQGFMLVNCYKTFFSSNCSDCQEVYFSKDLVNCQNCFGCTNLRHKKYHIFNELYSKEEYEKKIKEFNLGLYLSIEELKEKAEEHHLKFPNKYMTGMKNNNVTGEYIDNSRDIKDSYNIRNAENLKYCCLIWDKTQDCYDYYSWGENARLVYEGALLGDGINKLKFCFNCWPNCRELEYCLNCSSSSNLFGCVGLRHKQYCILNKQYTKKEYQELVPKIKKHMNDMPYTDKKGRIYKYGEFFPPELSPFGYNETIANEYFPLTKEQAIEQGYNWYDKPKNEYKPTIKAKDLPDHIKDVDDSILKEVIECANCHSRESGNPASGSPIKLGMTPEKVRIAEESKTTEISCAGSGVFKIIPQELKFYKKMNLPLPRLCPDCRHRERIKQRNPLKLWKRQCMKKGCKNTFETTYAPDRKEIVYCEKCYNEEVN